MVTPAKQLTLTQSKAPNLPITTPAYTQQYQDQLTNALRLYFNQLDNFTQTLVKTVTGGDITYPDGTVQKTAYVPGSIEAYDLSSSITINTTPTLLKPANFINSNNEIGRAHV